MPNRTLRLLLLIITMHAAADKAAAQAQIDPRLTGAAVIAQLEAAQRDLATRANGLPDSPLMAAGKDLADITEDLRKSLANNAGKPIEKIGDEARGEAQRGYAAAQRTQAFLGAATGCIDGDTRAMASALAATLAGIAHAKNSGKDSQPAIYAVETLDHRPLFAVRADSKDVSFALSGVHLHDAQCDDPVISATDDKGVAIANPPTITGVLPNRIELKLPNGAAEGSYTLHVVPKKRVRFLGCSAQPEAVAAIQIVPPVRFQVGYTVIPTCRVAGGKRGAASERVQPTVTGALPDITAYGTTVSRQIETAACADPVSYSISAKATYGDGSSQAVGPITQSAAAGITAGLPGGLSLSWDPTVRTIFVHSSANTCKGFY